MRQAKQKIYLETSVISAYFDFWGKAPEQKRATRKFFNLVKNECDLYVSEVVTAELERADSQIRNKLTKFVEPIKCLVINQSVVNLLEKYIKAGIIPASKKADATHLAVAVVNKIDYIVS